MSDSADQSAAQVRKPGFTRRRFLGYAGLTALSAPAVLEACANGGTTGSSAPTAAPNRSGGISVINFFTTEDDPASVKVTNDAIDAFEAKHEGVKIAQVVISNSDRDQRVLTGLSVGQDMGIFEVGAAYRNQFVDNNYLYPMDSLIKDVGEDQFAPSTRLVKNGHDWVFPYGGGPYSTWYRKDKISSPPKTFADVKAAAQANTAGSNYGIALCVGGFGPFDTAFPQFVWSHGGDYFDPQGNVIFGSDKVTAAIQAYVDMLKYAPPGNTDWKFGSLLDAYLTGRTAMSVYAGRLGDNIPRKAPQLEDTTGVTAPAFGPTPVGLWRWSHLAIDKKTSNPEMAKEFIKFLLTGDSGVKYANTAPGQLIPAIKSVREASLSANDPFVQKHQDWLQVLSSQIGNTFDINGPMGSVSTGSLKQSNNPPAPWAASAWGIRPIDMQMMQKIVLEKMSIKDGQAWAVDQLKGIVKDYKTKNPSWKPPAG